MWRAGLGERQQIEVLPDLDELALGDLAHQDDRQIKPYRDLATHPSNPFPRDKDLPTASNARPRAGRNR
jgi:hypothetical protein